MALPRIPTIYLKSGITATRVLASRTSRFIATPTTRRFCSSMPTEIPKTQTAWKLFLKPKVELKKIELPVPTPSEGQVLLKVAAAGMCHTDLHTLDGDSEIFAPCEFVMGHEISARVAKVGPGLDPNDFPIGKLFALHGPNGCGHCQSCRSGRDNHCTEAKMFGLSIDGGYEQYIVSRPRSMIPVPEGVSPEVAAVTTDAVLTPFHAIKMAGLSAMSKVLIIGLGGLGMNSVQICKAFGSFVTACDLRPETLDAAKRVGADETVSKPERPGYYDIVLDVVGSKETFKQAQEQVKPLGKVVPIGLAAAEIPLAQYEACVNETQVVSSFWGTSEDLTVCFELLASGKVVPQVEVGDFDRLPEHLEQLRAGKIKSRLAVIPPGNER